MIHNGFHWNPKVTPCYPKDTTRNTKDTRNNLMIEIHNQWYTRSHSESKVTTRPPMVPQMLEIYNYWYQRGFIGIQGSPIGTPRILVWTPNIPVGTPRNLTDTTIIEINNQWYPSPWGVILKPKGQPLVPQRTPPPQNTKDTNKNPKDTPMNPIDTSMMEGKFDN